MIHPVSLESSNWAVSRQIMEQRQQGSVCKYLDSFRVTSTNGSLSLIIGISSLSFPTDRTDSSPAEAIRQPSCVYKLYGARDRKYLKKNQPYHGIRRCLAHDVLRIISNDLRNGQIEGCKSSIPLFTWLADCSLDCHVIMLVPRKLINCTQDATTHPR